MLLYPCVISKHGGCSRIVAVCLLSLVKMLLDACNSVLCLWYFRLYSSFFCGSCILCFSSCNEFHDEIFKGTKACFARSEWSTFVCPLFGVPRTCPLRLHLIVGCHAGNHTNITWITVIIKKGVITFIIIQQMWTWTGITLVYEYLWHLVPLRIAPRYKCVCVCVSLGICDVLPSQFRAIFPSVNLVLAMDWTVS